MRPSDSTKERIFYQLAEYLDAGIPLPKAISQFAAAAAHFRVRQVLRRLDERFSGQIGSDFLAVGFSDFDAGMIEAGERSGRLAEAFRLLEKHYVQRLQWRAAVRSKLMYPALMFHLAVVILSVPTAVQAGDANVFFRQVLGTFAVAYGIIFLLWGGGLLIKWAMRTSVPVERLVGQLPFIGGVVRAVATERFAQALAMQLRAGVTVLSACHAAAIASGSRGLQEECRRVEVLVREGSGLAGAFGRNSLLAPELVEAIATGEQTGRLDTQCFRVAELLEKRMRGWADLTAEWLPRLIYFAVVLFVGWQMATMAIGAFSQMSSVLDI